MSFSINKISGVIIGVIMAAVFLFVGIMLGPTVTEYFGYVNATALAGVELAPIIILFASFGPTFYYLTILGGSIVMLIAAAKAGTG